MKASEPKPVPINIHLIDQLFLTDSLSLAEYPDDLHHPGALDSNITGNRIPVEVSTKAELPVVGRAETPRGSKIRRGGPRTSAGKERSKYNALKHGFFARVAVIDTSFYKESSKRYRLLRREYIRDLEPVDVCDLNLIEFVVKGLLDLERLWGVQQALTLERHIPLPKNDIGGLNRQLQDLLKGITSHGQGSGPVEETVPPTTVDASLKAERARIDALRKSLPSFDDMEWVQKCESHIMRQIYRALSELERRRNSRRDIPMPQR